MRSISTITLFTLTLIFVGCQSGVGDQQDFAHLEGCDRVQNLQMRSSYGSADIRVYAVLYESSGSYSTNMNYHVDQGETVDIPFCYGKGDVSFDIEVTPRGLTRTPSFDAEAELWFDPVQWVDSHDLELSWNGSVQDIGPTVGISSMTNNGESEYFTVAVRWAPL